MLNFQGFESFVDINDRFCWYCLSDMGFDGWNCLNCGGC